MQRFYPTEQVDKTLQIVPVVSLEAVPVVSLQSVPLSIKLLALLKQDRHGGKKKEYNGSHAVTKAKVKGLQQQKDCVLHRYESQYCQRVHTLFG